MNLFTLVTKSISSLFGHVSLFVRRALLVIGVFIIIFALFAHFTGQAVNKSSHQKVSRADSIRQEIYATINDPALQENEWDVMKVELYRMAWCSLAGEGCTDDPQDAREYYHQSLIGRASGLMMMPFTNPPASGTYWVYDTLENAGVVPKTYAAEGIGFSAMAALQPVWMVSRNFVFLFLVLAIVAIGFMIMFRIKLGGKELTFINALPRIVMIMILITFSYAIVGFLIDLMYVVMGLIIVVFGNSEFSQVLCFNNILGSASRVVQGEEGRICNVSMMFEQYVISDVTSYGVAIFDVGTYWDLAWGFYTFIPDIFREIIELVGSLYLADIAIGIAQAFAPNIVPLQSAQTKVDWEFAEDGSAIPKFGENESNKAFKVKEWLSKPASKIFGFINILINKLFGKKLQWGGWVGPVLSGASFIIDILVLSFLIQYLVTFILMFIFMLSIMYVFIKIFALTLKSYVKIIVLLIGGPAIIAVGMFRFWITNLLSSIVVFPLVVFFIIIAKIIMDIDILYSGIWQPPFLLSLNPQAFTTIVGGTILFMVPEFVAGVRKLIGAKDDNLMPNLGAMFAGAGLATAYFSAPKTLARMAVANPVIGRLADNAGQTFFGDKYTKQSKRVADNYDLREILAPKDKGKD